MSLPELCIAIRSRKLTKFYYNLDKEPGFRIVEPHMIGYNAAGHLALSAWYLTGASESKEGSGWREYLLSGISLVTILPESFSGPRNGYRADGGKKFHNVQCAL